jgi:hypothetical protein
MLVNLLALFIEQSVYCTSEGTILLSCKENTGTSKSQDWVDIIDSCMIADHSNFVGICSDGPRFTSGCHEDVKALISQKYPPAVLTQCLYDS